MLRRLALATVLIALVAPAAASLDDRGPVALAPDGDGGAVLAWVDDAGGVAVERVGPDGASRWPAGPVRIGRGAGVAAVSDGAGGAVVGWIDPGDAAGESPAIRLQRVTGDGALLWGAVGVPATGAPPAGAPAGLRLAADGADTLVAWQESTASGCCAVTVQRLTDRGSPAWGAGGVRVAAGHASPGTLALAADGAGGGIVAFGTTGEDGGPAALAVRRLDPAGGVSWGREAPAARPATPPAIVAAGGAALLAWATRDPDEVRALRLDAAGTPPGPGAGVLVTGAARAPAAVAMIGAPAAGALIVWQEAGEGAGSVRLQRLDAAGARLGGAGGVVISAPSVTAFAPRLVGDGLDGAFVAWQECPAGGSGCGAGAEVVAQRLAPAGTPRWPAPVVVARGALASAPIALVGDGAGGAIVGWRACPTSQPCEAHARRLADGEGGAPPSQTEPDLTIAVSTPPASAAPGQTLLVSNTARNVGAGAAGSFRVGFYLSSTTDPGDGTLIGFRQVVGLAVGATSTDRTAVTIPADADEADFFLIAVVDDGAAVAESDEGNNTVATPLAIVRADLVVSAVSAPSTGTIGGTLAVSTTVRNLSTARATATFSVAIHLSADATIDPATDRRLGARAIAGLAGGGSSSASTIVTIPADLAPGTYYLGAVADADDDVAERREDNNARAAATPTVFRVTIGSFTPTAGPVGTVVTVAGGNFEAVTAAAFNGVTADALTVLSPTLLRATVPDGAASGRITLVFAGGNRSSATAFRVTPRVLSFAPASAQSGDTVTITGTTLTGATVKIGTLAAPVSLPGDTEVVITVPPGARTGRLTVTTAAGTAISATDLVVIRPPTVSGFTPSGGTVGTAVVISGDAVGTATDVAFGGVSAGAPTALSATSVRAIVPAGAVTGPITVTNPAGDATSTAVFRVRPRITGFTPGRGLPGSDVTIAGTNLAPTVSVKFGAAPATIVSSAATEVVATVPAAATTGRIALVTADGTALTLTDFVVIRPPTIGSFSPTAAPVGASVTINGTNLASVSEARFNGVPAARPAVLASGTIRVVVPSGATSGPLGVTNAAGSATSAATFRVLPAITSVSPERGLIGDTVTITGTSFTGLVAVRFGGVAAGVVSALDTEVVVTVPVAALTGRIGVTTATGTATSPAVFDVIRPPTIRSFSPVAAPIGATVLVAGTNLASVTDVSFDGVAAVFTGISATQLTATVPAGAGTGPITVTNPAGTAVSSAPFRVAPKIMEFTPTTGAAGATVTITGSGFEGLPAVAFGSVAASAPTSVSPTALVVSVPRGAVTAPISVTTAAGTAVSSTSFTVIRAPSVTSFTPALGPVGTTVTLTGSNFTGVDEVTFAGPQTVTPTAVAAKTITVTVPAGAVTGRLRVSNPAGSSTSPGVFHVVPTVQGFAPTSGAAGTTVTITGTTLAGATLVRFGGVAAEIVSTADTTVVAIVPAAAVTGKISVTTADGTATSATDFVVLGPAARARRP